MRTISLVVPVYNEERTIEEALRRLFDVPLPGWRKEIIVVNDGSRDRTKEKIKAFGENIAYLENAKNLGKGCAIRMGVEKAVGELILVHDADLEYDPEDIPRLLAAFAPERAVFGSRNLEPERYGYKLFLLGDVLLTFLVNAVFGTHLTDVFTCYKLIPAKLFKSLDLKSDGFAVEMETTVKLLASGIGIREVPIRYHPRTFKEGKKFTILNGMREVF